MPLVPIPNATRLLRLGIKRQFFLSNFSVMFICGSSSISLKILVVIEVFFFFFENKLLLKFVSLFISSHYENFCTKILKS